MTTRVSQAVSLCGLISLILLLTSCGSSPVVILVTSSAETTPVATSTSTVLVTTSAASVASTAPLATDPWPSDDPTLPFEIKAEHCLDRVTARQVPLAPNFTAALEGSTADWLNYANVFIRGLPGTFPPPGYFGFGGDSTIANCVIDDPSSDLYPIVGRSEDRHLVRIDAEEGVSGDQPGSAVRHWTGMLTRQKSTVNDERAVDKTASIVRLELVNLHDNRTTIKVSLCPPDVANC